MAPEEIEDLRHLLYPLGFLSAIVFSARFLIQWLRSEKEHQSVVPKIFWNLSVLGNILLAAHAFIQLHFLIYFLQLQQALLAWRNIDLMKKKPHPLSRIFIAMVSLAVFSSILFVSQQWLLPHGEFLWVRSPQKVEVSAFFHAMGFLGISAISIRFWVQWWEAEHAQKSVLPAPFWWLSIIGMGLSGVYFVYLSDWVNALGPICCIVPYTRNLFLLRKKSSQTSACDIALVAGETSGDLIGRAIAEELHKRRPEIRLAGIAGKEMRREGVEAWLKAESFQVMGFFDVLKRLLFLHRSLKKVTNSILESQPKIVLFIDQPSLSLAVAKRLRKKKFLGKIVQIVAPTVWAYKKERIEAFAALFDHIMPLYRFECAYFQDKMPTTWVGHPILETIEHSAPLKECPREYLVLFPGSRESEINKNLPLLLDVALLLKKESHLVPAVVVPDMLAPSIHERVREKIRKLFPNAEIVPFEQRYQLMREARVALTKSGTVTLELALLKVPFVCCFQTGFFTRFWLKNFCHLETDLFALPNIFAKKKIFPEHILPPVSAESIARDIRPYILGTTLFPQEIEKKLLENIDTGSPFGKRVADAVEEFLR